MADSACYLVKNFISIVRFAQPNSIILIVTGTTVLSAATSLRLTANSTQRGLSRALSGRSKDAAERIEFGSVSRDSKDHSLENVTH